MKKAILILMFIALCLSAWAQSPQENIVQKSQQQKIELYQQQVKAQHDSLHKTRTRMLNGFQRNNNIQLKSTLNASKRLDSIVSPAIKTILHFDDVGRLLERLEYNTTYYNVDDTREVAEYDSNGNQISFSNYIWDDALQDWAGETRTEDDYYANGDLSSDRYFTWRTDLGEWSLRHQNDYDENGNNTLAINTNNIDWGNRKETTYNNDSQIILETSYELENAEWIPQTEVSNDYDTDGQISVRRNYEWENSQWTLQTERTYEHTSSGNLTTVISHTRDSAGHFLHSISTEKAHNPDNQLASSYTYQSFTYPTPQWEEREWQECTYTTNGLLASKTWFINYGYENHSRQEYSYNSSNDLITRFSYYKFHSDDDWILDTRKNYQYDSEGRTTLSSTNWYDFSGVFWSDRSSSSYDANGNRTLHSYETKGSNYWLTEWKHEYTYDQYNNITQYIFSNIDGINHKFDYTFDYTLDPSQIIHLDDGHMRIDYIKSYWDRFYSEWHTEDQGIYHYSDLSSNCPDYFEASSQQEIDDFPINYPECTIISGNVDISGTSINNLDGLSQITEIQGDLTIAGNALLTDISGLENLNSIGGELIIISNSELYLCGLTFICDYLANGGTATIYENVPGCSSIYEVQFACMPVVVCPDYFEPFSQQEIDDFPSNYPNCTTIGSLDLTFAVDATNLDGLIQLTTITEDVFIGLYGPVNIDDISGLQNVTSIGGVLVIDDTQLTDMSGLENLTSVAYGIQISNNPNLTTLSGLENLDAVSVGGMSISNNENLSVCNLPNICTYLDGGGTVSFNSNALGCDTQVQVETTCSPVTICPDNLSFPTQQDIDDFPVNYPGCLEIPGGVRISLDMIDNLDGLSQIASIGGNLTIESSDLLELTADISGLQNLTTIGGDLRILTDYFWTNPSLDAFQNLTSIGENLDLSHNGFTDLSSLQNLETVGGSIDISGEPITSLDGLENIDFTNVTNLRLNSNGNLSFCHLPNICEYIENGGTSNISANATGCATQNEVEFLCLSETACLDLFSASSQQEIDDFPSNYPNCTSIGKLDLHFPTDITNLDSLIQLTSIVDYVEIGFFEPNNIADISGLQNITSIGGYLQITGTQLTDLSGFQSLTSVGDYIWIIYNKNLLSLNGLENLDPNTISSLDISANDNLSVCSLSNICTYLDEGLGSYNIISDNSSGCNSEAEVQADCSPTPPDNPCNGTASTDSLSHIFDEDLFIDGVGFANNPNITFTNSGTPANAVLSDISLELYFRLNGNSCENEIALQITDPAGNTQPLTAYTTCNGGTGLFFVNLDVPAGSNGAGDWLIEFDDTNDQNADYEYSVRFARLNYVASTEGGSGETVVNEVVEIADMDLFIDGLGFANNPSATFTDPGTPANAVLSDISLELYFRLNGASCENEIALQITDPAGNTQPLTAYTTCDGGTGLFFVNLDVPSGSTTGSVADWVLEFDDTNDQNADYEYSVRFGRLTYTTTYTDVVTPVIITDEVVRTADSDLFIDGVGFDNNPTYVFFDPATPANADLSDIQLELYFRLNGASCENEIAIQLTDPAGNTQPLTAYTTCDGGTDLFFVNLNVPSGSTTGSIAPWTVQFDDTNDQNSDYEYSVRFGRLTYTTQYDLCNTQMMIVEENDEQQQLNNSSTQQFVNPSTQQPVNSSTRQLNNSSLKLYPVPASQHLNVEYFSETNNSANIEIISNEGKMLMSQEAFLQEGINTIQLDIADLPAGHYHIRMYNADDMQMQSFVKLRP